MSEIRRRLPGPVWCLPEVLARMSEQMINHRGIEFKELLPRATKKLQEVFMTKNEVLTIPGTGTHGLEALLTTFVCPGDKVIATSIGYFGDRWAEIAGVVGADVVHLKKPWGEVLHPDELEEMLKKHSDCKAVLITDSETATGAKNPLAELADVASRFDVLIFVDAVSSLGAMRLDFDKLKLDGAVAGIQKGLATPPGFAVIALSPRVWQKYDKDSVGSWCLNLRRYKDSLEHWETPSTPPISLYFGLDESLDAILAEGLENVFARHKRAAEYLRQGAEEIGWHLFADPRYASDSVTALKVPEGIDGRTVIQRIIDECQTEFAGGIGPLKGEIIRIGHMGPGATEAEADKDLDALRKILR